MNGNDGDLTDSTTPILPQSLTEEGSNEPNSHSKTIMAQHPFVTSTLSLPDLSEKTPAIAMIDMPGTVAPSSYQSSSTNYQPLSNNHQNAEPVLIPPSDRQIWAQRKMHRPYFMWLMSLIHVSALVASFILNQQAMGSPIQLDPFNPMIGASVGILIHMGARYDPCMRPTVLSTPGLQIRCPQGSSTNSSQFACSLEEICGLGGFPTGTPNQGYRFFLAILLHGGVLHLLFNLAFQLTTGAQLEKEIGWMRLAPIYLIAGVGGFIFGGNFAGYRTPSLGSSGALFGLIACLMLDLLHNWSLIVNPGWELAKMISSILFAFCLGMLPGIDNFSHIGGFMFGILAGLLLMPTFYFSRGDRTRKIVLRALSIPALILLFAFLLKGYYDGNNNCPWCQYLNCIPGLPW